MYKASLLLLTFLIGLYANSQELHHQMIGAQSGSFASNHSIQVEQSIGQLTVHSYQANDKYILQGFQQNVWKKLEGPNNDQIAIKIYPNPFVETITFSFSKPLNYPLQVKFFDLLGRIVIEREIDVQSTEVNFSLPTLSTAEYFVVLSSSEIKQSFKILKK